MVVSCPSWVLGIELKASATVTQALIPEPAILSRVFKLISSMYIC